MPSCSLQSASYRTTITQYCNVAPHLHDDRLHDILEIRTIAQSRSSCMSCIEVSPVCSNLLDPLNGMIPRGQRPIPGFLLQRLEVAMELRTKVHLVPLVWQKITWLCGFLNIRRSGRMPVSRPIILFKGCVWV